MGLTFGLVLVEISRSQFLRFRLIGKVKIGLLSKRMMGAIGIVTNM